MNAEYWREFYKTPMTTRPSDFAISVEPLIMNMLVYDMGCGNGRDTEYFRSLGHDVIAIDQHLGIAAEDYMNLNKCYGTTYARWFLHAVEEEVEDQLLDWAVSQLFIETRIVGDTPDDTHSRRLIDPDVLAQKLLDRRYEITYFKISRGFSPHETDETPLLLRLHADRKGVTVSPLAQIN